MLLYSYLGINVNSNTFFFFFSTKSYKNPIEFLTATSL